MSTETDTKPPQANVDRETLLGRFIGPLMLLSLMVTLVAPAVGARDIPNREGEDTDNDLFTLLNVNVAEDAQLQATMLRLAGYLILIPVGFFLYRLIKARNPSHPWFVPPIGLVGLGLLVASLPVSFYEVRDLAREFVALPRPEQTLERAEDVFEDARGESTLRLANLGQAAGNLMFGIWISITSVEMGRVGLLSRFLAVFGVGAGIATAIFAGAGIVLFIGWLGSVAVLSMGWWPGGRPQSWEAGRAIPWDEGREPPATTGRGSIR